MYQQFKNPLSDPNKPLLCLLLLLRSLLLRLLLRLPAASLLIPPQRIYDFHGTYLFIYIYAYVKTARKELPIPAIHHHPFFPTPFSILRTYSTPSLSIILKWGG